ncbi:MAG: hypothetical protein Ta2F_06590 [Termitinemataceae bacterium]|nr:MAG: hypothetical protein Ta2F_06590 [Termitinemataceae bacterium]
MFKKKMLNHIKQNKPHRLETILVSVLVVCGFFVFVQADDDIDPSIIPKTLLRPIRSEVSIYPIDAVIGELGQGDADGISYSFARSVLGDLQKKASNSERLSILSDSTKKKLFEQVDGVIPRKYRLGGGKKEVDGTTSFLFRFIGREKELAGELYLLQKDGKWIVDDILTEDVKPLSQGEAINTYVFTPYERFY